MVFLNGGRHGSWVNRYLIPLMAKCDLQLVGENNKTDRHDIAAEILLKVALDNIILTLQI
jgi:hypothetical protein